MLGTLQSYSGIKKAGRLKNSVPERGTRPSIFVPIEGRLHRCSGGHLGRRDGLALAGHCQPDLCYGARPSVDRVPPCSILSRLAKWLSHSGQHRVEGQVWSSCSFAQQTRRSFAHSSALCRPITGASQMSDEAAVRDDLAMLMVSEGMPRAPAVSHPSIQPH